MSMNTYNYDRLLVDGVEEASVLSYYEEYLDKYGKDIPKECLESMREDVLCGFYGDYAPCYIMQFYDEYNLMKDEWNLYKLFIELIKHNHPDLSNKTVLDVGGGVVPSLGKRLAKDAKHVIVVDYDITDTNNPNNLEVIKKRIEKASELPKADLVIGFFPCQATRFILEHAGNTNSDFMIGLCGCVHDDDLRFELMWNNCFGLCAHEQEKRYLNYAKQMIEEHKLGELQIDDSSCVLPYPIIGNKRI